VQIVTFQSFTWLYLTRVDKLTGFHVQCFIVVLSYTDYDKCCRPISSNCILANGCAFFVNRVIFCENSVGLAVIPRATVLLVLANPIISE